MKKLLTYQLSFELSEQLSLRQLAKIIDAVYAGIKSELEDVRKDPENPVQDYQIESKIQESTKSVTPTS